MIDVENIVFVACSSLLVFMSSKLLTILLILQHSTVYENEALCKLSLDSLNPSILVINAEVLVVMPESKQTGAIFNNCRLC